MLDIKIIPNDQCINELKELMSKWRSEGNEDMADTVERVDEGISIYELLVDVKFEKRRP